MDISQELLKNQRYQELIKLTSENDSAHDLDHHIRVRKYALQIGEQESADLEILEAAAMLHDIARGLETTGRVEDHLLTGAEISKEILAEIDYLKEKIEPVSYAISVHQSRAGITPKTLESKILQDADLLDTYGLIYVARSILWGIQSSKYKRPLFVDEHIEDFDYIRDKNLSTIHYLLHRLKNPKLDPSNLHTSLARKIASDKQKHLREFVETFIKEWRGEL